MRTWPILAAYAAALVVAAFADDVGRYSLPVIGFAAGLLLGRWRAVLLALLVPFAYALPEGEDSPLWAIALAFFTLPTAAGLALGVAVGKVYPRQ